MIELTTEYQSNISNKKRLDQNKSTCEKNVEPFKIYLRIKPLEDSTSSNIYHHLRLNKKVISTIKTYKEIDSNNSFLKLLTLFMLYSVNTYSYNFSEYS